MEDICPKDLCVGCWSCMNICSHQAIRVVTDECGFRYPSIDPDRCVDCGLCQKSCPVNISLDKYFPKECYAVTVKEDKELKCCASGGAATAISRQILQTGGVVYGCSGKEIRHVKHIRITQEDELPLLQGSKYVQSDTGLLFQSVRKDLLIGHRVFFVGTPCQIGGLKAFLKKDYANLITADLVCHGVPSQKLLNDNIDLYQSRGFNLEEETVHFREKRFDRHTQSFKIEYGWFFRKNQPYSNTSLKKMYYRDPYMFGFIQGLFFRASCYKCSYAYAVRVADLTLSDFWGLGKDSGMDVGKGVSSVLINTDKGEALFNELRDKIICKRRDVQEAIVGNGQLQRPSSRHLQYDLFRKLYPKYGLEYAVRVCLKKDLMRIYLKRILSGIKKLIKL